MFSRAQNRVIIQAVRALSGASVTCSCTTGDTSAAVYPEETGLTTAMFQSNPSDLSFAKVIVSSGPIRIYSLLSYANPNGLAGDFSAPHISTTNSFAGGRKISMGVLDASEPVAYSVFPRGVRFDPASYWHVGLTSNTEFLTVSYIPDPGVE